MTCLVSFAAPQPEDRPQDSAPSGGLALAMVSTAIEQLRGSWIALGLDGSVFLAGEELHNSLAALRPSQRRELLIAILGLCEDTGLCRELQAVMERGLIDPAAGRSVLRLVATLQPVLALQLPRLRSIEEDRAPVAPGAAHAPELQQDIALLGLTIRLDNALRRNEIHRISDLIGRKEPQLLSLRSVGANGLRELRDGLERLGLPIPLVLDLEQTFTPPAPLAEAIAAVVSTSGGRRGNQPAEHWFDAAADARWLERAGALIGGAATELPGAPRMLEELSSLTLEHFSTLPHRREELQQLRTAFQAIEAAAGADDDRCLLAEGLQGALLQAYGQRFSAMGAASGWLRQLHRAVSAARAVENFLRYAAGESLRSIADSSLPPISHERVRQTFRRLVDCAGLDPRELASRLGDRREQRELQRLHQALQPWLLSLGRLPFHTDEPDTHADAEAFPASMRLEQVIHLNLNRRLGLYAALALAVPEAEWALHFRVIANNEEDAGHGYWHHADTLGHFLRRYAVLLGTPGRMPKQKQLPASVQGAVQRHGRQSGAARRLGLHYQGQLTGENGRAYWTEQRLSDLLDRTVAHSGLAADAMPNKQQITAFLASGVMPEYLDRQPNSVFAALRCQYTLSWQQVAERFGRVWQG